MLLQFRYAAHVTPGLSEGRTAIPRAQLLALEGAIQDWLDQTTSVESGGKRCTIGIENIVGPDSNDDLDLQVVWSCDVPEIQGLRIDFRALAAKMADWQTIASMKFKGETLSTVLTPAATRWVVGDPGPVVTSGAAAGSVEGDGLASEDDDGSSAFSRFFHLGVEHIWTGYDHLLFLLAVLLAGGGIARLAGIVTSFTLAHSVTLGAAATGLVRLPVEPVEVVIALSIVFVAVENLLERGADRRALVTFGFGLIHGFGFASVLSEIAMPAGSIVMPLLAFNLGVEAGQLAVVLVVVPILNLLLRGAHARRVKQALSILIALAGLAWAVERIAGMFA